MSSRWRFRISADGALRDVCAIEGAESPAAPAALDAFTRAGRVARPTPEIAACIEDRDLTATFDLLVNQDDR